MLEYYTIYYVFIKYIKQFNFNKEMIVFPLNSNYRYSECYWYKCIIIIPIFKNNLFLCRQLSYVTFDFCLQFVISLFNRIQMHCIQTVQITLGKCNSGRFLRKSIKKTKYRKMFTINSKIHSNRNFAYPARMYNLIFLSSRHFTK